MVQRVADTGRALKLGMTGVAIAALVLAAAPDAYGQFFQTAGKSARSVGMADVFMAGSGDANSYWYNPAGLTRFEGRQVGLTYGIPLATISDLTISQLNFVTPIGGNSGLGLGIAYGGIEEANEMVVSGGYGIALTERFSLGANVKMLRWATEGSPIRGGTGSDEDLSKVSVSLDVSAMYGIGNLFGLGDFTTGVYVKDAIMPNVSESGDDGGKLPLEAGVGLMMQRETLLVEGDVAFRDGNTFFRGGAEYGIPDSGFDLRGGVAYGSDFEDDTEKFEVDLGLGYSFNPVHFNYAYVLPLQMESTGGKHYVSFGVSF